MAFVLCVGSDELLVHTRKIILERAGHTVVSATDVRELVRACEANPVDVAVLGQMMSGNEKLRAFSLVREYCPGAKVLSVYTRGSGRLLPGADDWLETPAEAPSDLADRVSRLAR